MGRPETSRNSAWNGGGKNPQNVFADADFEDTADGVAFGIAFNPDNAASRPGRLYCTDSV